MSDLPSSGCLHESERREEKRDDEHSLTLVTYTCKDCGNRRLTIEDDEPPRFDTVIGAVKPTQPYVNCVHSYFGEYDLVLHTNSGEVVRVEDQAAPGLYRITRGIGSEPTAWKDGDEVLKIGNSKPENPTT